MEAYYDAVDGERGGAQGDANGILGLTSGPSPIPLLGALCIGAPRESWRPKRKGAAV